MKKRAKLRIKNSDKIFNIFLMVISTIVAFVVLYPVIYVVSSSLSSGEAVANGRVILWPVELCTTGYEMVFAYKTVWVGYANTIYYTLLGTLLHVAMTIFVAYPLSRKNFQGRGLYVWLFTIPMFFGGGLIPTYILMSNLGLTNERAAVIISGAVSMSHVIIMRTSFQSSIPNELLESAKLDGITDHQYLYKIVIPLSKATISVITLYAVVSHWNAYFTPMIYLRDQDKFPLQLIVQTIMSSSKMNASDMTNTALLAESQEAFEVMKYALIVVSALPMIVFYPFIQKFFEKGVMIGSVKG